MVTTFDILVKMAGVPTVAKAPVSPNKIPINVNAPNATATPAPVTTPSVPAIATNLNPTGMGSPQVNTMPVGKASPNPARASSPIKPMPMSASKPAPQAKIALDAQAALLGLGGGLGGFALGKAFLEPSMQSAAKASPWILGALTAMVVGSLAAKAARKDENQKVHLEHALSNLSPAERQILLEQGNQTDLRDVGFHAGPSMHPSDNMAGRRFF